MSPGRVEIGRQSLHCFPFLPSSPSVFDISWVKSDAFMYGFYHVTVAIAMTELTHVTQRYLYTKLHVSLGSIASHAL